MGAAATAGHNSCAFGMDEPPPKGERIIDEVRVRQIHLFLTILSKLSDTPKKIILARRKSGKKGRSLRRLGIHFANFLRSPQWEQQRIFGLDRKQIGEEETAISKRLEADPGASWAVGRLFDAMSMLLSIDAPSLFGLASSPPQSKVSVDRELESEIPIDPDEEEKPKPRAKLRVLAAEPTPDQVRRAQEAARLVAERHLQSKLDGVETRISISKSVIAAGDKPEAGKEARDAAKAEVKTLEGLLKEKRSLRRAMKELETGKRKAGLT